MAKQSERHPKLLKTLELCEDGCDIETLARRVGVSERTVRRDIAGLRELGLAIEERVAAHGRKTYTLKPNALSLRLTYDEAVAVLWHCEQSPSLVETPWGESLSIGVKKIRQLLGPNEKRYVDRMLPRMHRTRHAADYRERGEVLDTLSIGIEECRATFITYQSARSTEPVTYDIHPYAIAEHRGTFYVVGFSCHHNELRTWKVDRMSDAEVTHVPFTRPKGFDAKAHFRSAFAVVVGAEPVMVRVRFTGSAARYVQEKRVHESQETKVTSAGIAEVTLRLTSTMEIKSWILSFGAAAEVLEPEKLRQEVIQELRDAASNYADSRVGRGDET